MLGKLPAEHGGRAGFGVRAGRDMAGGMGGPSCAWIPAAIALLVGCRDRGEPQDDGAPLVPSCASFDPDRRAFFGDLHVHTALSLDANLSGTRLRPVDAYRFARGEAVELPPYDAAGNGARTLRLSRPLDFVALSDHAEFLGLVTTCLSPGFPGYDTEACSVYRDDPQKAFVSGNALLAAPQDGVRWPAPCTEANAFCGDAATSAWAEVREAAAQAQDPTDACAFTSFVAYEWSASPGTKNLHRNVIFADEHVPALPPSYFDAPQEEALWDALERECVRGTPGCDVLTIPHNSNLSAGLMFEPVDGAGAPIDADYAKRRAELEPLVEIFQHKGSSECLPELGNDEECGFELAPYDTLSTAALGLAKDELNPADFVRDALGAGLRIASETGANPFTYGFVGSTDTHTGTPGAVEERGFAGHGGASFLAADAVGLVDHVWFNPGGLAVLWAEENSRAALFAAMKRREAYATSGSRIVLRTFTGLELPADLCSAPDFVEQGYARGVPMGGELSGAHEGEVLRVAVRALRDPGSAEHPSVGLERLQIVKGWLEDGVVRHRVIDVAGTASAEPFVDPGTCAPVEAGAAELCAVFEDDDFDRREHAFWYARVLEGPSCRWSTLACRAAQVDCGVPDDVPPELADCCDGPPELGRERAWASPVFYRP